MHFLRRILRAITRLRLGIALGILGIVLALLPPGLEAVGYELTPQQGYFILVLAGLLVLIALFVFFWPWISEAWLWLRREEELRKAKHERDELKTENEELIAEIEALQKASVPRSLPPDMVSSRHISNRNFRIMELVDTDNVIRKRTIEDCTLFGPGVLVQTGHGPNYFIEGTLVGEEDSFFWELAPDQQAVQGAIGIENCTFRNCRFSEIGVAGPAHFVRQWKAAFHQEGR